MKFATGHKGFDRAANGEGGLILTGNVISDTMFGFHVRGYFETECNGFTRPPGELQQFDLKAASAGYRQHFEPVRRWIEESKHFKYNSGWCYIIRHVRRGSSSPAVIHGVLVTDHQNRLLKEFSREQIERHSNGGTRKSWWVMDWVKPMLIANGCGSPA